MCFCDRGRMWSRTTSPSSSQLRSSQTHMTILKPCDASSLSNIEAVIYIGHTSWGKIKVIYVSSFPLPQPEGPHIFWNPFAQLSSWNFPLSVCVSLPPSLSHSFPFSPNDFVAKWEQFSYITLFKKSTLIFRAVLGLRQNWDSEIFPYTPLPLHMHSLSRYQHHSLEWYIFYKGWSYVNTL